MKDSGWRKLELRDFSSTMDANTLAKIGSIKLVGIDGGKIRELAVENAVFTPPSGDPASLERLPSRESISSSRCARWRKSASIHLSASSKDWGCYPRSQVWRSGISRASNAPQCNRCRSKRSICLWGQFINAIPSQIRAATKFTAVVDPSGTDPNLRYLVDAGIKDITVDFDFGAAWNENTKMIAARPVTLTVSNVIGLSANAILSNVRKQHFRQIRCCSACQPRRSKPAPLRSR